MSERPVLLSRELGVATIVLNRPEARNALDTATKVALLAALREVAADTAVRCVVLIGAGRAFCAGQDLKEHLGQLDQGGVDAVWSTIPDHYNPIALAIHEMDKPVVAAVNGVAAGAGASLALLADYRLVAATAGINVAFGRMALSCDTGTSWTLPRLVGPTRALELLLTGRTVLAAEALAIGIASEVVDDADFARRLKRLARSLAAGPTSAYAAMRRSVAFSATHSLAESLVQEGEMMRQAGASEDHRAAVEAFLSKREPEFSGH